MTATTSEKCSTAQHFHDVGTLDERLGSEGFAIRVTEDDPGPPLPSGVFHLVIADTLGDLPMGSIRPTTVQALVTELSGRLAESTLKLAYGYMVAVFRAAVRDRVIAFSPCEGVRLPPPRRKQVDIPPLEVIDVLAASLLSRFRVVPALVAASGLRQGELFGLEVGRVDFLRGRAVDVAQQLVCLAPDLPYLGPVKTAESERVVPLAQITLDALAAHLASFPTTEVTISDRIDPRKPVTRPARLVFTLDDGHR
ncbi:MAG: site-specific integrase [Pseudonocardiaceae bacterium]